MNSSAFAWYSGRLTRTPPDVTTSSISRTFLSSHQIRGPGGVTVTRRGITVVAVTDLTAPTTLAHLLAHDAIRDSVYGRPPVPVLAQHGGPVVDGVPTEVSSHSEPDAVPGGRLGVDLVLEVAGRFLAATRPEASPAPTCGCPSPSAARSS